MERIHGVIEDAHIYGIYDLFTRKPNGLKFNDTDALVITVKTDDEKKIYHTFYFCLKPDGTFDQKPISHGSRARIQKLVSFLTYYGITEDVERYNLKEHISEFKGERLEVLPSEKDGVIYIPQDFGYATK